MHQRLVLAFSLLFLGGCAGHQFTHQDARYTGPKAAALTQTKPEQVLVRASTNYNRSKLHQIIWGKHYRAVWSAPVPVPVLDLNKLPVKLRPNSLGGGLQTTSLSLRDEQGRTFTLRTLDKDPSKSLPPRLQKTLVSNIMRDQTSAINPYAAFTVPPLAEAVGIFHTNPQPYYVPPQAPGLGNHADSFGGKLVMLEEKFENVVDLSAVFGPVTQVLPSEELFQNLNQSAFHRVDQLAMARARLFDVVIGDWDRHEGQWTWARYNTGNGTYLYKPIPKDRDYAYYRYQDGVLTWLLTRRLLFGKVKPFIHNIPDVGGLIYKGRALDSRFLNELTATEWDSVAKDMQRALTREVLQSALQKFPDTVYQLEGDKTFRRLQKQVNKLPRTAQEYYRLLAREVTIYGSGENEKFVIKRMPDKTTLVEVYKNPTRANEAPQRLYRRVFRSEETKKITLHGLETGDEYQFEGKRRPGPTIIIHQNESTSQLTGVAKPRKIKI